MSERQRKGFKAVLMTIVGGLLLLFGGGCLLFNLEPYFRSARGIAVGLALLAGGVMLLREARKP